MISRYHTPHCPSSAPVHGGTSLMRALTIKQVYIYPVSYPDPDFDWTFGLDVDFKENWLYYSPPLRMWARRNRALVTSNPEEACLLIPAATATHLRGKCKDDHCERWAVGQWLQKLQYWDGGRNHAVFDQEDMWGLEDSGRQVSPGGRITSRLSKYATFDVSKAIALHNSADRRGIRLGFDLPVLRFFNNKARYVNNENLRRNSNREKLACMVGIYRDDMHFKVSRRAVHDLHNGNDIFVVTGLEEDVGSWKDLLPTCKFGLLPPGGSTFRSFRFLEVLSAGAVPVIVNTGGMMPYEHMVDWNALGVVIEEREIGLIPDILRSMSENDYLVKQRRTVKAYEYMFSTSERVIDTTIGFLKDEVARALREHGQEVCEQ